MIWHIIQEGNGYVSIRSDGMELCSRETVERAKELLKKYTKW